MVSKTELTHWTSYFYYAIRWNALESIVYQLIYLTHQFILFCFISNFEYAKIGAIFSLIFLAIPIFNFGLDKSLITFFNAISTSKKEFKRIIILQFIVQFFLLTFVYLFFYLIINKFLVLDNYTILYMGAILFIESFRKSCKTLCQLFFLNKFTSITEISAISLYVIFFWVLYFNVGITPTTFFLPLVLESLLALIYYIILIRIHYLKIGNKNTHVPLNEIFKVRFYIFITQLSSIIFSTNLLLPLIGYRYGLDSIAHLFLTKSVIAFLILFFEKTFGITSGALITRVRDKGALNLAFSSLYKVILFISSILFLLFIIFYCCFLDSVNFLSVSNVFLLIMAILLSSAFIPQEQYLIVTEKIYFLCFLNCITGLLFYSIASNSKSLTLVLIYFILLRFIEFIILSKLLKLKMNVSIKLSRYKYATPIIFLVFLSILVLITYNYYISINSGI